MYGRDFFGEMMRFLVVGQDEAVKQSSALNKKRTSINNVRFYQLLLAKTNKKSGFWRVIILKNLLLASSFAIFANIK